MRCWVACPIRCSRWPGSLPCMRRPHLHGMSTDGIITDDPQARREQMAADGDARVIQLLLERLPTAPVSATLTLRKFALVAPRKKGEKAGKRHPAFLLSGRVSLLGDDIEIKIAPLYGHGSILTIDEFRKRAPAENLWFGVEGIPGLAKPVSLTPTVGSDGQAIRYRYKGSPIPGLRLEVMLYPLHLACNKDWRWWAVAFSCSQE